jgi:hypothetical protein
MPTLVLALVILVAVASRPVEVRLWRAGRMSDRTLTLLMLGRFPVLTAVFLLLGGATFPLIAAALAISLVPGIVMYRYVLNMIRKNGHSPRSN